MSYRKFWFIGNGCISVEIGKIPRIGFDIDHCCDGLTFGLAFIINLWITFDYRLLHRFFEKVNLYNRSSGFEIYLNGLLFNVELLNLENNWNDDWNGWKYSFDLWSLLKGNRTTEKETIMEEPVIITMPEGKYHGTAKLYHFYVKHSRWFTKRYVRCDIDIPGGIPIPGKGTTSYNCGDDAVFGRCALANSINQAVEDTIISIIKDRLRYGGQDCLVWNKK